MEEEKTIENLEREGKKSTDTDIIFLFVTLIIVVIFVAFLIYEYYFNS